jgi:hypothetical protein
MTADHFVECARFRGGQQHKIVHVQRALVFLIKFKILF